MRLLAEKLNLPKTFLILLFGIFINRLGGFVIPFLTIFLTDRGHHTVEYVGGLASMVGLGSILAGTAGGYLSDRFGRKIIMIIALLLGALNVLAVGFFHDTGVLPLACFAMGLFSNMHRPGASAAINELIPQENQTRAFGLIYWVGNIGFSGAMILGGLIATRDFKLIFILDAATTVLYALLILFYIPETKPQISEKEKVKYGAAFFDLPFVAFTFLFFGTTLIFNQSVVALPVDMRSKAVSAEEFGKLMALNGVLIAFFQPFVTSKIEKKRASHILSLSVLFTALGFGLHYLANSALTFVPGIVIWTFGEMLGGAFALSTAASCAPANLRASYMGFFQMAEGLAITLAPIMGATVIQHSSSSTLWIGCLCLGIIIALAHLQITRTLESLRTS